MRDVQDGKTSKRVDAFEYGFVGVLLLAAVALSMPLVERFVNRATADFIANIHAV